MIEDIYNQINK